MCIEIEASFDGQITLSDFSLTFGGGDDGATATIAMFNQDEENIHILLPGENFDPATNRIAPGGERNASLDVNIGDTITMRADRNGTVLDEVACPAVEEVDYSATVVRASGGDSAQANESRLGC